MGGYGSGRHGGRATTTSCYNLDINRLNRGGSLRAGYSGVVTWSNDDGDRLASIGIAINTDEIELAYTHNSVPKNQMVRIDRTPCHFGNTRPWFRCPFCSRRVGKLYIASDGFACRKCYRLTYTSTRMDAIDRSWRRVRNLEAKLADDRAKPKGMHWRTYNRLQDRLWLEGINQNQLFVIGACRVLGLSRDDIVSKL